MVDLLAGIVIVGLVLIGLSLTLIGKLLSANKSKGER